MSASTSAKLLGILRGGGMPAPDELRAFVDRDTRGFFRDVVEPLADSFDTVDAAAYERLMQLWIPSLSRPKPVIPPRVEAVYVLSRVTLGADIKIVSPMLATMKLRFPDAHIILVGNRKSRELFEADSRIEHLESEYPRSGGMNDRLKFADDLRSRIAGPGRIVIDPDSRMTQLGLMPVINPEAYFHFPSRTIGGDGAGNLSDLTARWLIDCFGMAAPAYLAALPVDPGVGSFATVSLGVGENDSKRVGGDFEAKLIALLGGKLLGGKLLDKKYEAVWVDRGAGGAEADRVTAAVAASGAGNRVRFWEGGFAGFASLISQSELYVGYDSAGQHAAAASGVRLISIFAGAPSERFRARWSASGLAGGVQVKADGGAPEDLLAEVSRALPRN